jgi:hypothetical protein
MRGDDDAAFRARQAANTAATDNPNILAWTAADVLRHSSFRSLRICSLVARIG